MLKIHGVPVSVHTRKVILVALAKGLEYESLPVVPVMPASLPPNWRDLSPTGKIPVLSDGDFTLADSAAICAYLERRFPAQPIYPAEARDYARALFFEQYAGQLFADVVRPLFHEVFVHPRLQNVAPDPERIQDVLTRVVPRHFGYLDSQLDGNYLVGDAPTVADYALTSNLVTYRYLGFDLYAEKFPRLAAHFERMLRLPAMREAMTREQPTVDSMKLDRRWHVQDR
ncbi:MAG TPA: glutathione S-transferase family protein [Steroidobacteraceae bacterium]|nr:glutathione S-transferase family protein [Steroidobacteraceae bacterium]